MICERCGLHTNDWPCACGWQPPQEKPKGSTLRLNECDVPGCHRVVSAGNPEKNLEQGFHVPTRCRFHRDPTYEDVPRLPTNPVVPSTGPLLTFDQVKEDFERIKAASAKELHAYWQAHGITPSKPGNLKP